ncbi:MAG: hypothetical protein QGG86_02045 [Candidatus Marinimicrobia bacterium]|nr:hypothetical protein [Candidatus Neomarinimicrobiota bacterium]
MSPEFSVLHLQYIDKFGDGFNTIAMSEDEEKALIPLMRKAIDTNEKIKHKILEDVLGKDFDDPNVEI